MFGHDDDQTQQNNYPAPAPDNSVGTPAEPVAGSTVASSMNNNGAGSYDPPAPAAADTPVPGASAGVPAPVAPTLPDVGGTAPAVPTSDASLDAPEGGDLLDLKQQALQQLTPLMDHLEQTPEEEFRTTMMMIQAADNKELIKKAYDAAMNIPDEKARAQALLDVVNEINYFTHGQENPPAAA